MKTKRRYTAIFWGVGLFFLGAVWFAFFHKFSTSWDIKPHSLVARYLINDNVEYEEVAIYSHIFVYPLYHLMVGAIYKISGISVNTAAAMVLTISNIVSAVLFRTLFSIINNGKKTYWGDVCSLAIMIFMPLCTSLTDYRIYARQCGPNPLHNPTVIFARPFGIATCIFWGLFITEYCTKQAYINYKYLITFGVMSALSVLAKPSFAVVFLPAMGLWVLGIMLCEKNIKCGVFSLIAVIPSIIILFIQYGLTSDNSSIATIHFQLGGFSGFSLWEIIAVSISTFPVVLILFHKKNITLSNTWSSIAIYALIIGWIQMFFLSDGSNGNFSWGYDLAIGYATLVTIATEYANAGKAKTNVRWGIAMVIFAAQVISGIIYICRIWNLGDYWI